MKKIKFKNNDFSGLYLEDYCLWYCHYAILEDSIDVLKKGFRAQIQFRYKNPDNKHI